MKKLLEVDRAYDELKKLIMNNHLQSGYPIYDVEIAERIGTSRTPVREAIQRLKTEGLLEMIPRKGVFVKSLSYSEIKECYELAEALEGMVAFLAAKNIKNNEIEVLKEIIERMDNSLDNSDINLWISADEDFHKLIRKIADNNMINNTLSRVDIQIHRVRILITSNWLDKIKSNSDHKAIIEAFVAHDSELAREIHHKHWLRIRMEILQILKSCGIR